MATTVEFTGEQLNYYRICYVVTDILTEGLRTIFKQEWDSRYRSTLGEWKDEPQNGQDFKNGEPPRNQIRNKELLQTMVNGNRAEWDCTMLFYALLYSNCIKLPNGIVKSNLHCLRNFRNKEFAHVIKGHISDTDFLTAISKIDAAFLALGLSNSQIQAIQNQTTFYTEELNVVLNQVEDLKKKLQEKDDETQFLQEQLCTSVSPFSVLPPKPSHDVAARDSEVAEIEKLLDTLKSADESSLSYLHISGPPGSGKSQLAGLAAKRFFEKIKTAPSTTSFVMTLNGKSKETLLESYVSFARHLKCPESSVMTTINAKDLTTDEKIANLKMLIGTKVKLYKLWLVIVDDVTNLSSVQVHLPNPGDDQWINGQLMITTTDVASIPPTSTFIQHISVSEGMDPADASHLLGMLSGFQDEELANKVARALDYQPFALASAASYVREVRQNKVTSEFGWNDFLKKLDNGQRRATETTLEKTNLSYPKSMTDVITLAVQEAIKSDKVLEHTFSFLSVCAPQQPLPVEIVVRYILNVDKELGDKEMITMRIRKCSLLCFEQEGSGDYIRVHQIVHEVINTLTVIKTNSENVEQLEIVSGAIEAFTKLIEDKPTRTCDILEQLVISKRLVPHLTTLVVKIEHLFDEEDISKIAQTSILTVQAFQSLGKMCKKYCEVETAIKYFKLELDFSRCGAIPNDDEVANAYRHLGSAFNKLGDFCQSKKYFEDELDMRLKKPEPDHLVVAATYNLLGNVNLRLGELGQARNYQERALAIRKKMLEPDHVDLASTYNNLGNVHKELGNLKRAKDYYNCSLKIQLEKLGTEHVDVAATYNNLGVVLGHLGDLKRSKENFDHALNIRLNNLGSDHVAVATTNSNLGNLYRQMNDLQGAKDCYKTALAIQLEKHRPEHVAVAVTCNNLGAVHGDLGELQWSECYHNRALAIQLKELGPEHVSVATTYYNLGNVHRMRDEPKRAKDCYESALAIQLKKLRPEDVNVALTYSILSDVYEDVGEMERSKDYYNRALSITQLERFPCESSTAKAVKHNLLQLKRKAAKVEHSRTVDFKQDESIRTVTCTML